MTKDPTPTEQVLGEFREAIRRVYERVLRERRSAPPPPLLRVREEPSAAPSLTSAVVAAALSRYRRA